MTAPTPASDAVNTSRSEAVEDDGAPPSRSRRRMMLLSLGGLAGVGGVAGALAVGWGMGEVAPRLRPDGGLGLLDGGKGGAQGPIALNGFVRITPNHRVHVVLARAEMGQGVATALAMLLAEELDADWSQVLTEMAPIDPIYNNLATVVDGLPFHPDELSGWLPRTARHLTEKAMRQIGINMTGGSSTVKDLWLPMRQAGALARALLLEAAARRSGLPREQLRAEGGRVFLGEGRSLGYGDLAEAAARLPPSASLPALKLPQDWRYIGKAMPRLDTVAKSSGQTVFAIDVRPPGIVYAAVRLTPTLAGGVADLQADKLKAIRPGLLAVKAVGGAGGGGDTSRPDKRYGTPAGVAVIAPSWWQAQQAVLAGEAAQAWRWTASEDLTHLGDASLRQSLDAALATPLKDHPGWTYHSRGDVDAALAGAARKVEARYAAPWLAHQTLEPLNCTVQVTVDAASGKASAAEVWASTQVPGLARGAVARTLGLKPEAVTLHGLPIGGGFGRRLEVDVIAQAAEVALALPGRPVQTIWSREDELRHDFYRPACVAHYEAGLDGHGRLLGWQSVSAGQAIVPQVLGRQFGLPAGGPDKTTAEGSFDQAYAWPASRAAHVAVDLPGVPVGFWRSVGHSHQAFFHESFVDEVAQAAGVDAVEFRARHLAGRPRELAVLKRAAELAGWGQPLAPAEDGAPRARGLALHRSFGSTVAEVVEISLAPAADGSHALTGALAQRRLRVHRVVAVMDCGTVVNPGIVRQQLESAVIFGLSASLHGEVHIEAGRVMQSNFHDAPVLRLAEAPERIVIELMPSSEPPEGVGEPGVPPLAPALANALHALTGQRLRSLPLRLA